MSNTNPVTCGFFFNKYCRIAWSQVGWTHRCGTHRGNTNRRTDYKIYVGLPWWLSGKETACQCRRPAKSVRSLIQEDPTCLRATKPIVVQLLSCAWLSSPMDCSMPGFPVHHHLPELAQAHVRWVSDAILSISSSVVPFSSCLQSPNIRVFSSESALCIRWPKDRSFSFSSSPSSEYSGLISFRTDWFDFFAVQGTLKSLFH